MAKEGTPLTVYSQKEKVSSVIVQMNNVLLGKKIVVLLRNVIFMKKGMFDE